ncbi:NAD-dependent epimerase/dehydratase family protein [bacterium]|nr:NAD-dependent epimerase/dehydratase family protein [bacterium]
MKALITGGTGFVGSHLVEVLKNRGWELCVLAKDAMFSADLGVPVTIADLSDREAVAPLLRDVDYVFHVAGLTRARKTVDYYMVNHLGTRDLLDACAEHCRALRRFVYVSSLTAVGPRNGAGEITEQSPYHPVSHYGRSKMMAEIEVMERRNEIPVTIVRPSAVYGPRDRDLFRYFKMIRTGIEPLLGSGAHQLNLVHVRDLVDGIIRAAEHPAAEGEAFFIGGENYSTAGLCRHIARAMQRRPFVFHLPEFLIYVVGAAGEATGRLLRRQVFFNVQKVREAVQEAWTCSIDKARERIGFEPRVTLDAGMRMTYDWYLEHQWL